MSQFKGTPGPWVTCDTHGAIENGGCVQEVASGRERMIAACCHYVSRAEVIANARLIAAAPELLEALQEVIQAMKITLRVGHERIIELGGQCDSPEVMIKGHSEIARAESAIKKALGQQQM